MFGKRASQLIREVATCSPDNLPPYKVSYLERMTIYLAYELEEISYAVEPVTLILLYCSACRTKWSATLWTS